MATAGRPTKLTEDLQNRLCESIRDGNYYQAACAYAGVSYKVFREWMIKGKKQSRGKFRDFREAVQKAQADAEITIVSEWRQHIPDNWQAARDFLARRFPDRWGQQDTLKILRKLVGEVDKMTDDELLAILNRSSGKDQNETSDGGS